MASYVQQGSVSSVAGGIASTPSITGVTAGNTLVCVLSMYSSSNPTATAPTDSSGQTWSILAQSAYQNPKKVAIFYLFNAAAGTHSLSMPSTTGPQVAQVVEYKGLLAVGGTAVAAGSSSFTTSQSSGNYTPSQANEVVIAVCGVDSSTNPETLSDPPTGWTSLGAQQNGATYSPVEFCYRETSSTTPVSATWSWTTAGASAIVVAGLKYYNSPIINTQPVQQSVASGSTATFSVSATTSGGALSYQWYLNSVLISGATSSSYTTPTLTNADNGNTYYCAVTDAGGVTNTATVYLFIIGESSGDGDKINSAWFAR